MLTCCLTQEVNRDDMANKSSQADVLDFAVVIHRIIFLPKFVEQYKMELKGFLVAFLPSLKRLVRKLEKRTCVCNLSLVTLDDKTYPFFFVFFGW